MRHALVVTQLIHEARSAGPQAAERQLADAPPEAPAAADPEPRLRRLATLFRRARVRALGLGTESPGGGA